MDPRARPTRALGSIAFLAAIGCGFLVLGAAEEARGAAREAGEAVADLPPWIEYVSPLPGSIRNLPETNVIVRPRAGASGVSAAFLRLSTDGSRSGAHAGATHVSDDGRTVTFRPDRPFDPGERVLVRIEESSAPALAPYELEFETAGPEREAIRDVRPPESEVEEERPAISLWKPAAAPPSAASAARAPGGLRSARSDEPLPADFPAIHVNVAGTSSPGKLFLSSFSQTDPTAASYLLMLENDGTPFFYRRIPARAHDFELQPDGRLTYYDSGAEAFYALDSTFSVVDSFRCGNGYTTDFHECRVLPNGHALLMSFDPQTVDMTPIDPKGFTNATVIGLVVQEIDREKNVVFQWRSWDHFEITDAVGIALGGRTVNYVHGNSIDVDSDGNLILSARSMNRVTKISRVTGEILWTLGGVKNQFRFLNDGGFSRQHAARRLPNGDLLLFDNGNFRSPPYSRAVEYALDETRMTVRLVWQYRHEPDVFGPFAGYAHRLPTGNTVIGWGTTTPTVTEVTPAGEIVSELSFDPGIFSYRAYRFEWPPILAALVALYPKTINTAITAGWVTAKVEPVGFEPARIDIASVTLAGVPAEQSGAAMGDANGNGAPDLTLSFSRAALARVLTPETMELELRGSLDDGKAFHGFGEVKVVSPPDGGRETLTIRSAPGELPVRLGMDASAVGGRSAAIYDARGRLVRRLAVDRAGAVEWDGRGGDGRPAARGIYFARIEDSQAPAAAASARKIILVR